MRFDDRLLTVLNQPAGDRHDTAVRWRQLVDLVARAGPNSASPIVAQALESIREEASKVDEPLRAAAARAVAALPLPLGLLECFAADRLAVSAPVLAAASLDRGQWQSLLSHADDETRRFIETLHPELTAAEPDEATEALVEREPIQRPKPAARRAERRQPAPAGPSLSDVVARIERRRRSREQQAVGGAAAAPMPAGAPGLFRWECGPSGEIAWVEGAPRGALIGRSIARTRDEAGEGVDEDVARAFAMRAPFRDAAMNLGGDGLASGEWKISGVPAFEPADWSNLADESMLKSELRARVAEAIVELPPIYREPVILRDLEGFSTGEASSRLRVKDQTLKSRLHRGRMLLRQQLADFADGLSMRATFA